MNPKLLETNMETHKGPYKDYSPSERTIWASMLVSGSVNPVIGTAEATSTTVVHSWQVYRHAGT